MKAWPKLEEPILSAHCGLLEDRISKRLARLAFSSPAAHDYLDLVRDFVLKRNVLTTDVSSLRNMAIEVERKFFLWRETLPPDLADANKALVKAFDYTWFEGADAKGGKPWGGVSLMRAIYKFARCCPYCNAESIYLINKEIKRKTQSAFGKSAFDHFLPKARYPFLSVSVYNLIPACDRCNSKFKRDDFKAPLFMWNPYDDAERKGDFDSCMRFVPLTRKPDVFLGEEFDPTFELRVRPIGVPTWWKGVLSERLFQLSSVYSQLFAGDAIDAIHKQIVFSPAYLDMVKKWFTAAGLGTVNVERLVFGIPASRDSINLQRLGKLKLDLQRQFEQK